MKPWFERKQIVSKEDYEKTVDYYRGWTEVERLGPGRTSGESVRVSHRMSGNMIAGWDEDRIGQITYWIVQE